ncbi:hypothetical protein DMUE_5784, partial [Dictyocoela muelleri]
DLWTSYYSHKNCNNILKNEINKPIITLDEKIKFECKDKSCQNKNCNNYQFNFSNKCDWNNLNEDEEYKFETYDWNNDNNFKSNNCDLGPCHDKTDDLIDKKSKCFCQNCCYFNTFPDNQNLDKENYNNQNLNNQCHNIQNYNNHKPDIQSLGNQNLNNQCHKMQYPDNQYHNNQYHNIQNSDNQYHNIQNSDNQNSYNTCLNNCFELPEIKTIITQPCNSSSSYHPDENVSENQKEFYEDAIALPQVNLNANNTSPESKMVIKDTGYDNFSSYENYDVLKNNQNNNESYIPTVKYESSFDTIDNKINKGEKIKHFNQDCKNYYQNTSDPSNYTISKPNSYFYEIKNNNEINQSLNEVNQNLKYDDLSNYDLKMNPENKNNDQNNNPGNEVSDGKDSLNKDSKSKISENQKVNKKKNGSDKKKKTMNNCVGYISKLTIVWSTLLILI